MDYFLTIDWVETFVPMMTLPEVLIRGTLVYFALLALLRVIPKWQAGPGSVASLLFVVILGGLAGDAIKGKAETVTDLLLMIGTVMLWVVVVDRLSYRFRWIHFLAQDSATCLIRDGRILQENIERETIDMEDLKAQLRQQGVDEISNVREAYLEPDGTISVIKAEQEKKQGQRKKRSRGKAKTRPRQGKRTKK